MSGLNTGMGTTCQTVITRALQKLGIVGAGNSPTTYDNALGLEALKAVLQKQINTGAFGDLIDVIPAASPYDAGENERIVNDGSITVNLPVTVPLNYGESDYGLVSYTNNPLMVRPPMDLSVVEVVRTDLGTTATYLYDNRQRTWTDINALTANAVCPLASRDENGLCSLLALHLASEFGQQPDELTQKAAYDFGLALAHNWSQRGEVSEPKDWF